MATRNEMICQSTIIMMGWTKKLIDDFLPAPTLVDNPHYKRAPPMKLWDKTLVESVMTDPAFITAKTKADRRKSGASKAVETKKERLMEDVTAFLETVTIDRVDVETLKRQTLSAKQSWYNSNSSYYSCYYTDYEERDAYSADESTVERWIVNYIRHNMTRYDHKLYEIHRKTGSREAYREMKIGILRKIAETYPQFKDECDNQIRNVEYEPL